MNSSICCILNFPPHYRTEVYLLMEKELGCSFYFGNDTIARNLRKVDFTLFSSAPSELKFVKIVNNLNWLKGSIQLCFKKRYKKFIITGEPFCLSSWILMVLCRIMDKPVFLWTHGFYGRETGFRKWIKWVYFKLPKGCFLYGNYAKEIMSKLGFKESSLIVIYNSLSFTKHISIRSSLKLTNSLDNYFSNKLPIIMFIGRVTVQKRLNLILESLSYAKEHNKKLFNFFVIGDGNYLSVLKDLVKDSNISEYVYFYGACYEERDVAQLIYNSDLCVSPGEVGLTGIHALTFGTPVITHNNFSYQMPEFGAIIRGKTGDFFRENDSIDLYNVIINWLDSHPVKDVNLIQNCFETIQKFYNPTYQVCQMKATLNNS